jgi:hypothetical protein
MMTSIFIYSIETRKTMYNDPNQSNPNQPPYNPNQQPYNPNQQPYNPNQPQQPYNPEQAGQPYQQPYNPGQAGQPYPPQGFMPPPQPPKKKRSKLGIGCGAVVALIILIVIIVAITSNSGSSTASTSNTGSTTTKSQSTTAATKAPAAPTHFKVGQVVKVGDTWEVTVNSVKTNPGGQYDQVKGVYLLLDVTAKNVSGKEQNISSILNFKLTDSTGVAYTETISMLGLPNPPDGKVEAGAPSRGTFTFDVPKDMKSFTFAFTPDFLADGQTIWDLTD